MRWVSATGRFVAQLLCTLHFRSCCHLLGRWAAMPQKRMSSAKTMTPTTLALIWACGENACLYISLSPLAVSFLLCSFVMPEKLETSPAATSKHGDWGADGCDCGSDLAKTPQDKSQTA